MKGLRLGATALVQTTVKAVGVFAKKRLALLWFQRLATAAWWKRWTVLSLFLCAWAFSLASQRIDATVPYPQHFDEAPILNRAHQVLETGDLNPHWFRYPSLSVYVSSMAMVYGSAQAAKHQEIAEITDLKNFGRPHYDVPRVSRLIRHVFAGITVLGMLLIGIAAATIAKQPALRAIAPAFLLLSPRYRELGFDYVNPDTLATTIVAATLAWLMLHTRNSSMLSRAIIPGLLTGAAAASKYNAGAVIVPCVMTILLYSKPSDWGWRLGQLVGFSTVGFLLCCPFALLNLRDFMDGVLYEAAHYGRGHRVFTVEAGWPHAKAAVGQIFDQFGWPVFAAAAVGLVTVFRRGGHRVVVLVSSAVATFYVMSQYKVLFLRNMMPTFVVLAVLAAVGVVFAWRLLARGLRQLTRKLKRGNWAWRAAPVLVVALLIATVGPKRLQDITRVKKESRIVAAEWLKRHVPVGSRVVLDKSLGIDRRTAKGPYKLITKKPGELNKAVKKPFAGDTYLVVAGRSPKKLERAQRIAVRNAELKKSVKGRKVSRNLVRPGLAIYKRGPTGQATTP